MKFSFLLAAALALPLTVVPLHAVAAETQSAQAAVDELLAADRAFSARAADVEFTTALRGMLRTDAIMPSRLGGLSVGPDAIVQALRSYADIPGMKASWQPVRGGVSADGQHGFTYGFMTYRRAEKPDERAKYLSYWIRDEDGWKLFAFKRGRSDEGTVSTAVRAPAIPSQLVAPDPAAAPAHRASLAAAEKAFSDEAQSLGLGPAFIKNGSNDAMNMGPGADFTFGNQEIGGGFPAQNEATPIYWSADAGAISASSGDLGMTWGWIRNRKPAAGQPDKSPFFTVWRRVSPQVPWRYIAE